MGNLRGNTPPPTRGIRHVALNVRDLAAAERFYVGVLGYVVEWRPDPENLYVTCGEDNLALHVVKTAGDGERARDSALDHFGLLCDRPEDVHAWAAYLQAHGVALDTQPRQHRDGATSFYARDPDGNRIQFIHHPPISART